MTGTAAPAKDYSRSACEARVGADAMADIRRRNAAARPPTAEQIETLRRIFGPAVNALTRNDGSAPTAARQPADLYQTAA